MSAFTLRARWVVPVAMPPIEGGYVAIAGARIAAVGGPEAIVGPVEDLGDVALLPGLVNAHCHLEFSSLTRPLGEPGSPLPQWIAQVIAERKRADRNATAAVAAGMAESLAAGVTTIGEIATNQPSVYATATPRPRLALLHEAIGFSAARSDSVFADVASRAEQAVADGASVLASGVSPHAPYTVHPELVSRLADWAAGRDAPIAMHLAESPEELQLLAAGDGPFRELLDQRSMWDPGTIPAGTRPVDYLRRLAAAPRALAVHGNYFGAEEIEFLAAHRDRLSVVYCPRTHGYFGHEPYPLAAMQKAGVRVVLGTDSRASNPDLNLWSEARAAMELHPTLSPEAALGMATLDSAGALGLENQVGSLAIGRFADLATVPLVGEGDVLAEVLNSSNVTRIWLAGRSVLPEPLA